MEQDSNVVKHHVIHERDVSGTTYYWMLLGDGHTCVNKVVDSNRKSHKLYIPVNNSEAVNSALSSEVTENGEEGIQMPTCLT